MELTSRQGYSHRQCGEKGVLDPNWIAYAGTPFLTCLPTEHVSNSSTGKVCLFLVHRLLPSVSDHTLFLLLKCQQGGTLGCLLCGSLALDL